MIHKERAEFNVWLVDRIKLTLDGGKLLKLPLKRYQIQRIEFSLPLKATFQQF